MFAYGTTNKLHEEPRDYFRYTKFELREIFSRPGFEILVCEQIGGFFTTMTQLTIRYVINKLNLYQKKWGRLVNPLFKLFSKLTTFLDKVDRSQANRRHTLTWFLVLRK